MIKQSQNIGKHVVLVIVAHRDDEVLGAGGTIAKHAMAGDIVFSISMTDGVGARGGNSQEQLNARIEASKRAERLLGLNWMEGGTFPDNSMDTVSMLEVIKVIERVKLETNPTLVYTHSAADLNIDHRIVAQATLTCFRPQPNEIWSEVRAFEIASSTDFGHKSISNQFSPNLYVDISDTWEMKLAALKEYDTEMRDSPHSRSYDGLENLARYRGNQAGLHYAEAFEIIRKIER